MTTDNFCFYLQNRLIQTSQTGGQWYSNSSPFSIPWFSCWNIVNWNSVTWDSVSMLFHQHWQFFLMISVFHCEANSNTKPWLTIDTRSESLMQALFQETSWIYSRIQKKVFEGNQRCLANRGLKSKKKPLRHEEDGGKTVSRMKQLWTIFLLQNFNWKSCLMTARVTNSKTDNLIQFNYILQR